MSLLKNSDPEIASAIASELHRQQTSLELIPSENTVSEDVMEAQGTVLTNKYAEGYPEAFLRRLSVRGCRRAPGD